MCTKSEVNNIDINTNSTSITRSIVIGATAGLSEVLINHPLWVIKTRKQCKYNFTLNPLVLYKGVYYHAYSEVLLAIFQISVTIQLTEKFNKNFSKPAILISSLIGGAISGLITCPTELVMTQQQKYLHKSKNNINNDFFKFVWKIAANHGYKRLFLGAPCTIIRESLYTCGFFSGSPIIGKEINQYVKNAIYSSFLAGIISGTMATFITHPFDTIKTMQQDYAFNVNKLTAFETAKMIYQKEGSKGFFNGIIARGTRVASATAIIGTVIEKMRPSL